MAESLFRYFRGTNHIFYEDLSLQNQLPPSPPGWTSGDLHVENFGSYKSDNRLVYFDLNDFDEGILTPVAWEIYRMVVSICLAFASLGIEETKAEHMGRMFLKSYSKALINGKADYIEPRTAKGIVWEFLTAASKRTQKDILLKKTVVRKHRLEFLLDDPKHVVLKKKPREHLIHHVQHWLENDSQSPYNYKVLDAVFRIAGTASLGLQRYALLLKSTNSKGEKYVLLDMKESIPSSVAPFASLPQPVWNTEANRIVSVQRRMQNRSPALLSTTVFQGRSFVIQEIQPSEDKIKFSLIKKEYRSIYKAIEDMGSLTAYAHLRSSGRDGSGSADDLIAFGKDQSWQSPLFASAAGYSKVTEENYLNFRNDYKEMIQTISPRCS